MSAEFMTVGVLHPGSMGAAVGGQLRACGVRVLWCPAGRSAATVRRAAEAGLEPVDGAGQLVAQSDLVLSLCPPAAAEEVAQEVAACAQEGFVYLEANAVTPQRVRRIDRMLRGAVVVDAAVVGSPPRNGRKPRLYVSGPEDAVSRVSKLFQGTDVDVRVLGPEVGTASSLKLSYSSFQKASRVLAAVAYATAEADGLGEELLDIAGLRPGSYLSEIDYIPTTAARAWRWGPELAEAAEHIRDAGLPDEIIRAAARVLERWNDLHGHRLELSEVLDCLKASQPISVRDTGDDVAGSLAVEGGGDESA